MAEAVLTVLATAILKSLAAEIARPGGSSASQKIRLLCCAEDELQSLESTVQSIQAVLLDAEKQQWHNDRVKLWLKRLKDVLYDIQDLFDDVATEDLRQKVTSGSKISKEVRIFFSKSNQLAHRLKVANKIQKLRKKLDRIKKDREFSNLEQHQSEETRPIVRRRTPAFEREEDIIGREEDKKAIIAHLLDSSSRERVSVVSILGIGGLGKTTLADLVYKDEKVKCFELKMWVCHGDPKIFDVDLIIKEILKSAKDECRGGAEMMRDLEGIENKNEEQLRRLLGKVLEGKKYLLVLDDLWNDDRLRWLKLRPLLIGGSRGSKILVTTRNLSVVHATDANSVIHDLHRLSEDNSWELFKKMAFEDGKESSSSGLEEVGRDIATKCAGVPLAIKTIGSLLYIKKKKKEWLNFKERELSKIDKSEDGIMEVLKISYDHLPSHLKHCFAYCSLFPKDYVFDKQTMIQLWMAQGFIESLEGNEDLEKTGDSYVSDLLCRSFLKVEAVDDYTGEVKKFKMHDLMHDLALNVTGDECKMINPHEGGINGGIRHASLVPQSSSLKEVASLFEETNVRTFLSLKTWKTFELNYSPNEYRRILSKIRHCRTLALPYAYFCIPPSLGSRLKHLRFLDVSGNWSIKSLPDSITDLVNLRTLKLSYCNNLTTLPRDLRKLVNLRHLLIDGCTSLRHMPCGLNHLSSLQTLSKFVVQEMDQRVPGGAGIVDDLGGLNKLAGSIHLEQLEFLQPAPNKGHLREKEHLRSLDLEWWAPLKDRDEKSESDDRDEKNESDELIVWENLRPHQNLTHLGIYDFMGRNPPSWLSSIECLVELNLRKCGGWKYLPPLSELPFLRKLYLCCLDELEFVQEIRDPQQSNTARPFFPSLEILCLDECGKLKGWWGTTLPVGEEQDHVWYDLRSTFPKLSYLDIQNCHYLKSLPLLPSVLDLKFFKSSVKILEQQVMAVPNFSSEATLVSTSIPLSKLKKLYFCSISDLDHSILETLLPLLRNLESMSFVFCHTLRSLSSGMQYLSSLQHLEIISCEELDLSSHDDEHSIQWRSLMNLRTLVISKLPKLVALSEGMQHVTTMQSLSICSCKNLKSLPKWIDNFSLLQDLDIFKCPNIVRLPDGMLNLTSLKRFRIGKCPTLWSQIEYSADWEKIKGIMEMDDDSDWSSE